MVRDRAAVLTDGRTTSVRVASGDYLTAIFPATFYAGFLIYLEYDWAAAAVLFAAWILLPVCFWTDRVAFDGKRLVRTGILPRAWAFINGSRTKLRLSDIEQVETLALRALKRGSNVFYHYRTTIRGKDTSFVFGSGGENYRQMIQKIFSQTAESVLDNRSLELRDYLADRKETLMKAEFAHIPSAEVLENSFSSGKNIAPNSPRIADISSEDAEKAVYLHRLGNELRLSGYLLQGLETLRRALLIKPRDARLIFDFARCLHSYAGSERSEKLEKKSLAALRLAEKRAAGDTELLARIGESYFQFGDFQRARKIFQSISGAAGESFRAVRGLAEIALRDGKIAHVIHHFSTADRLAETPALRRWSRGETEYFSRLNESEEYMEMEISRVNLLETLENARKTTLKIALTGFPLILIGVSLDENLAAHVGWAISSIALLIWAGLNVSQKLLSPRIPFELIEEDED